MMPRLDHLLMLPIMPLTLRRLLPLAFALAMPSAHATDLLETLHLAELKYPEFAAVRAARGAAEKTTDIARAALLPQVTVTGNYSSNSLSQDQIVIASGFPTVGGNTSYKSTEWNARVTQPLFNWGAFHRFEASKAQRSRDEAKADDRTQQLTLKVAEAYFNVLRAQDSLALARTREDVLNKKLDDAKARLEVGFIPKLDEMESEAQRDAAQTQRLAAEDQLNTAREQLTTLIGQPVDSLDNLRDNLPLTPPLPADPAAWARLSIAQNPSLIAARRDLTASESSITALKGDYLPQINAFASHDDRTVSGSNNLAVTLNSGQTDVIGIEARWDLFNGGRTRASKRQAELQAESQRQDLLSAEQDTANQARTLFMTVRTDVSRLLASQRSVNSASQTYSALEAGYQIGSHSIIDLMNAEAKLDTARHDYANIRYDYVIDSLRLHATAGMLDDSVISRYNDWLTNGHDAAAPGTPAPAAFSKPAS